MNTFLNGLLVVFNPAGAWQRIADDRPSVLKLLLLHTLQEASAAAVGPDDVTERGDHLGIGIEKCGPVGLVGGDGGIHEMSPVDERNDGKRLICVLRNFTCRQVGRCSLALARIA